MLQNSQNAISQHDHGTIHVDYPGSQAMNKLMATLEKGSGVPLAEALSERKGARVRTRTPGYGKLQFSGDLVEVKPGLKFRLRVSKQPMRSHAKVTLSVEKHHDGRVEFHSAAMVAPN